MEDTFYERLCFIWYFMRSDNILGNVKLWQPLCRKMTLLTSWNHLTWALSISSLPILRFLKANLSSHFFCLRGRSVILSTLTLLFFWNLILLIFAPLIFFLSWDCFPVLKQQPKLSQSISLSYITFKVTEFFLSIHDRFTNTMILLNTSLFSILSLSTFQDRRFLHHFGEAAFLMVTKNLVLSASMGSISSQISAA